MPAKMMVGKTEYQLWITNNPRPIFGEKPDQETHIYERFEDVLAYLSLLDPIVVGEDGKPNQYRTITKVVRWTEERNETEKKKIRENGTRHPKKPKPNRS